MRKGSLQRLASYSPNGKQRKLADWSHCRKLPQHSMAMSPARSLFFQPMPQIEGNHGSFQGHKTASVKRKPLNDSHTSPARRESLPGWRKEETTGGAHVPECNCRTKCRQNHCPCCAVSWLHSCSCAYRTKQSKTGQWVYSTKNPSCTRGVPHFCGESQ